MWCFHFSPQLWSTAWFSQPTAIAICDDTGGFLLIITGNISILYIYIYTLTHTYPHLRWLHPILLFISLQNPQCPLRATSCSRSDPNVRSRWRWGAHGAPFHHPGGGAKRLHRQNNKNFWLVVWSMNFMTFHLVGKCIIPTDELIFLQRGRSTTKQICDFSSSVENLSYS